MSGQSSSSSPEAQRGFRRELALFPRMMKRGVLAGIAMVVAALVGATGASAFWMATGTGSTTTAVATLAAPTNVTVPSSSIPAVPVSWTASAGTVAPTGYYVTRVTGTTSAAACGSSAAAPITGTSCTDASVPAGTYTYIVTAVHRTWTAASTASTAVTVVNASKLVIPGAMSNVAAGAAIAVTVNVQSSAGTSVPAANLPVTISIANNAGGGTLSGTLTAVTNSSGAATFTGLSIDKAGTGYTLRATTPGLTVATSSAFNVTAAAATQLAIISGPTSGTATSGSNIGPFTVQRQDAYGNPVSTGTSALTVKLASDSTADKFSVASNGSSVTQVTIPAGSHSTTFYYGDTKAGTATITASVSGSGIASASKAVTIAAASAARIAFVNATTTSVAARTSTAGPLIVEVQDNLGNRTAAPAGGVTLTFSSSSASTSSFSLTSGGAAITKVTVPAGSSVAEVYFGDTKAGTPTVTVTGSISGWSNATQAQTVTASTAVGLAFGQQPTDAGIGQTISPAVTAMIVDEFGNRTTSTATVTIAIDNNPSWQYWPGRLSGTMSKAAVAGLVTFNDLSISGAYGYLGAGEGYTLEVTSGSVVSAVSNPFDITNR